MLVWHGKVGGAGNFPLNIFPLKCTSKTGFSSIRVGVAGNAQILLRVTRFQPATLQQPCLIACLFAFLFKLMQQANKQTKLACLLFDLLFSFFVVGDSLRFARGMDHFSVTSTNILASSGLLLAWLHFREFFFVQFFYRSESSVARQELAESADSSIRSYKCFKSWWTLVIFFLFFCRGGGAFLPCFFDSKSLFFCNKSFGARQ